MSAENLEKCPSAGQILLEKHTNETVPMLEILNQEIRELRAENQEIKDAINKITIKLEDVTISSKIRDIDEQSSEVSESSSSTKKKLVSVKIVAEDDSKPKIKAINNWFKDEWVSNRDEFTKLYEIGDFNDDDEDNNLIKLINAEVLVKNTKNKEGVDKLKIEADAAYKILKDNKAYESIYKVILNAHKELKKPFK